MLIDIPNFIITISKLKEQEMQNRYVADVGDFGKYALLRSLSETGYNLGVNWYLVLDEIHNSDGKHISYLNNIKYYNYDNDLLDILKQIMANDQRNVSSIQNSDILPRDTVYHENTLSFVGVSDPLKRRLLRKSWHDDALNKLSNCDIVFLDPDNGLQVKSVSLTGQKGIKYIGLNELKDYYIHGKSIIFYNHRERKTEDEYLDKFRELKKDSDFKDAKWLGLKFTRGTIRDYFFVIQPQHYDVIKKQIEIFLDTKWKDFFIILSF